MAAAAELSHSPGRSVGLTCTVVRTSFCPALHSQSALALGQVVPREAWNIRTAVLSLFWISSDAFYWVCVSGMLEYHQQAYQGGYGRAPPGFLRKEVRTGREHGPQESALSLPAKRSIPYLWGELFLRVCTLFRNVPTNVLVMSQPRDMIIKKPCSLAIWTLGFFGVC